MRPHPTTRPGYRPAAERQCRYCGVTFYVNPADVRRGRGIYCSIAHRNAGHVRSGPQKPRSARITRNCETCKQPFQTTENANAKWPRRFCGRDCYLKRPKNDLARFWQYVQRGEPDACWWWTGGVRHSSTNDFEYGSLAWPTGTSPMEMAHRISWLIHFGTIPDGLCVCHKCDHPLCVNPIHLFVDTRAGNNRDRHEKGRDPDPSVHAHLGETNVNAKLNPQKVRAIRARYQRGNIRLADLATEYAVAIPTIASIVNRKTWSHVLDEP